MNESLIISTFEGLNNRAEPLSLDPKWQTEASGLLLDNGRFFVNQPSHVIDADSIVDLFATKSGAGFAVSASGDLLSLHPLDGLKRIATGFHGAPFAWTELGTAAFARSNSHAWVIYPDRVVPWGVPEANPPLIALVPGSLLPGTYIVACALESADGRIGGCVITKAETVNPGQTLRIALLDPPAGYLIRLYVSAANGASCRLYGRYAAGTVVDISEANVADKTTEPLKNIVGFPPPSGHLIGRYGNRIGVALLDDDFGETTIYFSKPDNPHVFELIDDYVTVPGTVNIIADFDGGCVIGTDRAIYRYGLDKSVATLANYGATPGSLAYDQNGAAYLWTPNGLCRAEPFQNLTEARFVASPSLPAAATVFRWQGSDYYLCSTKHLPESLLDGHRPF